MKERMNVQGFGGEIRGKEIT